MRWGPAGGFDVSESDGDSAASMLSTNTDDIVADMVMDPEAAAEWVQEMKEYARRLRRRTLLAEARARWAEEAASATAASARNTAAEVAAVAASAERASAAVGSLTYTAGRPRPAPLRLEPIYATPPTYRGEDAAGGSGDLEEDAGTVASPPPSSIVPPPSPQPRPAALPLPPAAATTSHPPSPVPVPISTAAASNTGHTTIVPQAARLLAQYPGARPPPSSTRTPTTSTAASRRAFR